jgi:hypothetical protein
MLQTDHRTIFTALAFLAVAGKEPEGKNDLAKIGRLAALLDRFCAENTARFFSIISIDPHDEADTAQIDHAIDTHIAELRQQETTRLPEDRNTLLKYYDRLQQRKTRRIQSAFYQTGDVRILADRVLKYLDEEIEDMEAKHERG